jgi:hypothetical protein
MKRMTLLETPKFMVSNGPGHTLNNNIKIIRKALSPMVGTDLIKKRLDKAMTVARRIRIKNKIQRSTSAI